MLTNENYFSPENQMKYMGVSQFKAFEKCEAAALAELTGEYQREKTVSLLPNTVKPKKSYSALSATLFS